MLSHHAEGKFLNVKVLYVRYILVTLGCNVNNFCGKCWAIVDPKLTGPIEDPCYRGPDYRVTTVCAEVVPKEGKPSLLYHMVS